MNINQLGLRAKRSVLIVAASAVATFSASADPVVSQFRLSDHPDGNQNPPPYGLRFDNLFSHANLGTSSTSGTVTTFSMDYFGGVILTVTDDSAGSGAFTINISGRVYGGEINGSGGYGFGEGAYDLDFTYRMNVATSGTGWIVNPEHANNNGTLTAEAGITGVSDGTVFSFWDKDNGDEDSFIFLQDDHRLNPGGVPYPQFGQGYWVARGWVQNGANGTHDFLFLGEEMLIPLPSASLLAGTGLLFVGTRRRRVVSRL